MFREFGYGAEGDAFYLALGRRRCDGLQLDACVLVGDEGERRGVTKLVGTHDTNSWVLRRSA